MINRVILVGNLTKDSESITTTGRPMTKMRLATNSRWRNSDGVVQESVEFHSVLAFGRLAETAALYCLRGRRIYIEGRLRTRPYDASDGTKRYSTDVVAETLKLLQSRSDTDAGNQAVDAKVPATSDLSPEPTPLAS